MKVSQHFARSEFDCHDGTQVPDIYWANLKALCDGVLEPIRASSGPLAVISGYRSPEYNRAVGGVGRSNHMTATAADVRPMEIGVNELHQMILSLHRAGSLPALGGLGLYPTWIHVDTLKSADGHLRRWTGSGVGSEAA